MKAFLRIAILMTGILAIAVALIILGRTDNTAKPSSDHFGPSGVSAFADILQKLGYQVRSERSRRPKLANDELAIAVSLRKTAVDSWESPTPGGPDKDMEILVDRLDLFLRGGGRLLAGHMGTSFGPTSATAPTRTLTRKENPGDPAIGPTLTATIGDFTAPHFGNWENNAPTMWFADSAPVVSAQVKGRGVVLSVTDAIGMSNRYIDQADNARFFVSLVEAAAPAKKVVFLEAAHGDIAEPGLLESIGRWLQYGWTQAMLVLLVIAYAVGKRFGLPVYDRFVQRGQRDLVDALAFLYRRAKADDTAIHAILRNADRDIRRSLKLSFDAPVEQRNQRIPDSLRIAIEHAQLVASIPESPPGQVLGAAHKVEQEVAAFIQSRTIIRPKAKRRAA